MVDAEYAIFSTVANALRADFADVFVTGEKISAPPSFPAVSIVEMNNSIYTKSRDLAGTEQHSTLMYEINGYSALSYGKKAQCKNIMVTVDEVMQRLGFSRIGQSPMEMPNADASKYRMVARYRAVISKSGAIHRIM